MTVVGTVLTEPEIKRAGAQRHELVTFWVRSSERRFDKGKEQWVDGRPLSVRVTCWRRLARGVHSSLHKGDPVIVNGRLYCQFADSGQARVVPEVEACAIGPNLAFATAPIQRGEDGGRGSSQTAGAGDCPSVVADAVPVA
ncbi:single-stranded DNA-binding protein [Amycolatopsis cynarae]|uniref:Single-stranded DNA-binding protein n=1 Tax=Amycolatopsis cynarae TaxID=2995223 RepID=A0ABY7AYR3_9PSEU|nr:single-stranded DNA-binding protein [Amycolatopsis sp. HUAS 11-8]WAL64168.1 single-stranded DNA-binding protein [Amycolatopsis sp. HUAS 11-8]